MGELIYTTINPERSENTLSVHDRAGGDRAGPCVIFWIYGAGRLPHAGRPANAARARRQDAADHESGPHQVLEPVHIRPAPKA